MHTKDRYPILLHCRDHEAAPSLLDGIDFRHVAGAKQALLDLSNSLASKLAAVRIFPGVLGGRCLEGSL